MTVPDPTAASTVASSPSGCAIRCMAMGATRMGADSWEPSSVHRVEGREQSTSIRGTRRRDSRLWRLLRRAVSVSAPDA